MGANPGFQFKTHPNIDKQLFANESSLGLRDPTRPFPVGSAVGVLKWRLASSDEALLPLLINAWHGRAWPNHESRRELRIPRPIASCSLTGRRRREPTRGK